MLVKFGVKLSLANLVTKKFMRHFLKDNEILIKKGTHLPKYLEDPNPFKIKNIWILDDRLRVLYSFSETELSNNDIRYDLDGGKKDKIDNNSEIYKSIEINQDVLKKIDNSVSLDFFNNNHIEYKLDDIYNNIDTFSELITSFKKILFISSDYPGYGGAATNCLELINFFSKTHDTYGVFYLFPTDKNKPEKWSDNNYKIVSLNNLKRTLLAIPFKPDLIILKNFVDIDLRNIFKCPIYYLVAGIYKNNLDINYNRLETRQDHDKYINQKVLEQIKSSDYSFTNSSHTQKVLNDIYGLKTYLFYSSFVPFYKQERLIDSKFESRIYEYGLIMSDFTRSIKNAEKTIEFLKDKKNVILIGKNSEKYRRDGWTCLDLMERDELMNYYKKIKHLVQDSHYESCSNVMVDGWMRGCICDSSRYQYLLNSLISVSKKKKTIIFISFIRWTSGILRGYNISKHPLLQKSFNIEYFMFEGKHIKLLKYIRNSIVVFVKGNLRKLPDIKELFGENNYFIHDILDTYGDKGETFEDIKHYEKWFDLLLVNSKYMKNIFISNGINEDKIKVLYHPCDQNLKLINTIEDKVNYIGNLVKCDINLDLVNVSYKDFAVSMNRSVHFTYIEKSKIFSHFHTSTKLATCIRLKSIFVSNRIPIFLELLGNDYPFFFDNINSTKRLFTIAKDLLRNKDDYIVFYNKYYKPLELILLNNACIYNELFSSINCKKNNIVCFKSYFVDSYKNDVEQFNITEENIIEGYDYYIYTNSKRSFFDFLPYKKVYYNIFTIKLYSRLFSRYIKWGYNILFSDYKYSIYLDSYINIIKDNEFKYKEIITLLNNNDNIICSTHKCRKNIKDELDHLLLNYTENQSKNIVKENSNNLLKLSTYLGKKNILLELNKKQLTENGVIFALICQDTIKSNLLYNKLFHIFNEFTYRDQVAAPIILNIKPYLNLQLLFKKNKYVTTYR